MPVSLPQWLSTGLWWALLLLGVFTVVAWWLERKPLRYSVKETEEGKEFSFSLGIYGGRIRFVRREDCRVPVFVRRFDGWEIHFPPTYSCEQMDFFILTHNPQCLDKDRSHSKDLGIYREVVIRDSPDLACMGGAVYRQPA